jgi:hypothetical protein
MEDDIIEDEKGEGPFNQRCTSSIQQLILVHPLVPLAGHAATLNLPETLTQKDASSSYNQMSGPFLK